MHLNAQGVHGGTFDRERDGWLAVLHRVRDQFAHDEAAVAVCAVTLQRVACNPNRGSVVRELEFVALRCHMHATYPTVDEGWSDGDSNRTSNLTSGLRGDK